MPIWNLAHTERYILDIYIWLQKSVLTFAKFIQYDSDFFFMLLRENIIEKRGLATTQKTCIMNPVSLRTRNCSKGFEHTGDNSYWYLFLAIAIACRLSRWLWHRASKHNSDLWDRVRRWQLQVHLSYLVLATGTRSGMSSKSSTCIKYGKVKSKLLGQ